MTEQPYRRSPAERQFAAKTTELHDGQRWGRWQFCASNLTLRWDLDYECDLERIGSSAAMLDFIFQFRTLFRATSDDRTDLLAAFDDIFDPQAHLCSSGQHKMINPEKLIRSRIRSKPN